MDLHSYSQQILFPYAYTCGVEPPNIEKMEELALGLAKSIRLFSGESYSVKAACRGAVTDSNTEKALRIEPTGGSAIDWFYHELGAHYSYQIKLRDTGSYGFLVPSDYIIPTGVGPPPNHIPPHRYLHFFFFFWFFGFANFDAIGGDITSGQVSWRLPPRQRWDRKLAGSSGGGCRVGRGTTHLRGVQ